MAGNPIDALKEGCLVIRFPSFRSKIDTLTAMVSRAKDDRDKIRLEYLLDETMKERDELVAEYTQAFKNRYQFSKTAWFFDYDARDLQQAKLFDMDTQPLNWSEINQGPVFFMYFERTAESRIDALVIYDQDRKIVPPPFPNNFSRGGLNFLFIKMGDKKFADWRIDRINKRLYKFYADSHE